MNLPQKKVLILGAGLAGLGAGYRLCDQGFDVSLIETQDYIGGFASSFHFKECIFDYGPHAFHAPTTEHLDFFLDIMGDEVLVLKKSVKISFRGKQFDYPIKPANLLSNLDKKTLVSCVFSFINQMLMPDRNLVQGSLEQLYVTLYGRKLYELFFENYTEKVWGFHPAELSDSFLRHRLPNKNLIHLGMQSVKSAFGLQKKELSEDNFVILQYYPKKGSGRFAEKLKEHIISNRGKFHLSNRVSQIHIENETVRGVTTITKGNEQKYFDCDFCVSTIPITILLETLSPAPPQEIKEAAKILKFRGLIIFCLVINSEKVLDTEYLYFHHQIFNRVGQMNSFSPETCPLGKSALTVEITCFKDDNTWNANEDSLLEKIFEGLKEEGFDIKDDLEGFFVLRSEFGYPVPMLGYEEPLLKIFKYMNSISNLYSGGRQALFHYIQMFQALNMGLKIAESIISSQPKLKIKNSLDEGFPNFV